MYVRRYTADPGLEVLLNIESVNILDLEPSAPITSTGYGTIMLAGEFEDGDFNLPTEVFGTTDLASNFGGFGYPYSGVVANNPSARARYADGTPFAEYWNGNGMIALNGKKFSRLVVVRVDTSTGSVQFSRLACVKGAMQTTFALATGQSVKFDIGGGTVTAAFTGTKAVYTGGVFPGGGGTSHFVGGEWLDLAYDSGSTVRVTFALGDQTPADVAAKINSYFGFTFATTASGGTKVALTGVIGGTSGNVNVVAADVAGTLTAIGFATGITAGGGTVANILAVTVAEAHTIIHAASASIAVSTDANGYIQMVNTATPLTGILTAKSTGTAAAFGFTPLGVDVAATAASGTAFTIPAGTRVRDVSANEWVTMQAADVTATSAGPYTVKVRPAVDDNSSTGALANAVTVIPYDLGTDHWSVTNPYPLTIALTETQLDTAYLAALATTIDLNSVSREVNTSYSARQSNAVRRAGRQNAIDASAEGCYGRRFVARPPLGTTKVVAKGTAEPGVGAYRDERTIYCYPGVNVYVPAIATRGIAGGAGFTADGFIDMGADGFMASQCSLLPPEENPAQITNYIDEIHGVESSPNASGFGMTDYISFKANGIAAIRMDAGKPEFQSGVTSVDPVVHPGQVNIARRRMADQIEDSIALRLKNYGKKLGTRSRWTAMLAEIATYLKDLKDRNRIEDYSVDGKSGNTTTSWNRGARWVIANVQTIASMDAIILQANIGENVTITAL